jgi:hypothetical protein
MRADFKGNKMTEPRSRWRINPGNIIGSAVAGLLLAVTIGVWQMYGAVLVLQTKMEMVGNKLGTVDKLDAQVTDHEHRITRLEDNVLHDKVLK